MAEIPTTSDTTAQVGDLTARGPLWRVASPYFNAQTVQWIDKTISPDTYRFERVQAVGGERDWHSRRSARSSMREWRNYFEQAAHAFDSPSDGVIGVFPQLAASLAIVSRLRRDDRPIVSWFFNTTLDNEARRRAAAIGLSRIDRFVVHTTCEIEAYSELLRIPQDRFHFAPLQYGAKVETEMPGVNEPYVFATGSGYRDYGTFFAAMQRLGYKTLVLAGPRALDGLTPPSNVEIIDHMSKEEIRRHVRHARVNAIPLTDGGLAGGLVTIVESFRHGRGVVSTDRPGVEDYLIDGQTALLARLGDADSLAERIEAVWNDQTLSDKLDTNALEFGELHCTDAAAANSLVEVLDGLGVNQ